MAVLHPTVDEPYMDAWILHTTSFVSVLSQSRNNLVLHELRSRFNRKCVANRDTVGCRVTDGFLESDVRAPLLQEELHPGASDKYAHKSGKETGSPKDVEQPQNKLCDAIHAAWKIIVGTDSTCLVVSISTSVGCIPMSSSLTLRFDEKGVMPCSCAAGRYSSIQTAEFDR